MSLKQVFGLVHTNVGVFKRTIAIATVAQCEEKSYVLTDNEVDSFLKMTLK